MMRPTREPTTTPAHFSTVFMEGRMGGFTPAILSRRKAKGQDHRALTLEAQILPLGPAGRTADRKLRASARSVSLKRSAPDATRYDASTSSQRSRRRRRLRRSVVTPRGPMVWERRFERSTDWRGDMASVRVRGDTTRVVAAPNAEVRPMHWPAFRPYSEPTIAVRRYRTSDVISRPYPRSRTSRSADGR